MPLYPTFWSPFLKMAAISQVICLISETLRHRIITLVSTVHISCMGNIIHIMRGYVHHTNECIVGLPVVAICDKQHK